MSDLRQAAQMAMDYLDRVAIIDGAPARDSLRAALAQPEQGQKIEQAVEAEREACAKVCEQRKITTPEWQLDQHYNQATSHCAQAIRLRGRT